ncbi:MAG: hypothetical protein ACKVGW_09745 [Verrucomicrobiia bacterium]|jgi:hypothetical protein
MPKTYLLKKLDPSAQIRKGRGDDDQMRFCGDTEEEARQNTANYTQIPRKLSAPSPWKDPRLTSCEMEYAGEGVSGLSKRHLQGGTSMGDQLSPIFGCD